MTQVVREVCRFLASQQIKGLRKFLGQFHPADLTMAVCFLHDREKGQVVKLLDLEAAAES